MIQRDGRLRQTSKPTVALLRYFSEIPDGQAP